MCHVKRIEVRENNGQFNDPSQLTTDPIGRVFIADTGNNRICIHNPNSTISVTFRRDVKVSRDRLSVLCPEHNPCVLVLTLEGTRHSYILWKGMDVVYLVFCLDSTNFVISDYGSHFRVFSPEGNLLHTIGREGHQPGMFIIQLE